MTRVRLLGSLACALLPACIAPVAVDELEYSNLGYAVGIAGDVNGDGLADVIVGAPSALANDRGRTYVVFGFRAQAG